MRLKHYILEGFCAEKKKKGLACKNRFEMKSYCLSCPMFSYAPSPLEIAYSNEDGVVQRLEDWCGFGGGMIPVNHEEYWHEVWRDICVTKIREANEEYWKRFASSPDRDLTEEFDDWPDSIRRLL